VDRQDALGFFRHLAQRCTDYGMGNSSALATQIADKIELIPALDFALGNGPPPEQDEAVARTEGAIADMLAEEAADAGTPESAAGETPGDTTSPAQPETPVSEDGSQG